MQASSESAGKTTPLYIKLMWLERGPMSWTCTFCSMSREPDVDGVDENHMAMAVVIPTALSWMEFNRNDKARRM